MTDENRPPKMASEAPGLVPDDLHKSVLVVDRGFVSEAYYNGESDNWWLANTSEHDSDACRAIYPTHWMPMPDLPQ